MYRGDIIGNGWNMPKLSRFYCRSRCIISGRNARKRIVLHKTNLPIFQLDVAINTKEVEDCETRLRHHVFMQESEHTIRLAKFSAADALSDWIAGNHGGLSFFYNLTSCDLPGAPIPEFAAFRDHQKGVGGLVIERCAKLGMLKSDYVGERGDSLSNFQSDL